MKNDKKEPAAQGGQGNLNAMQFTEEQTQMHSDIMDAFRRVQLDKNAPLSDRIAVSPFLVNSHLGLRVRELCNLKLIDVHCTKDENGTETLTFGQHVKCGGTSALFSAHHNEAGEGYLMEYLDLRQQSAYAKSDYLFIDPDSPSPLTPQRLRLYYEKICLKYAKDAIDGYFDGRRLLRQISPFSIMRVQTVLRHRRLERDTLGKDLTPIERRTYGCDDFEK